MPIWTRLILAVWMLWGLLWLAAWFWAERTVARPRRRIEAPYRIVNILGFVGIFGDGVMRWGDGGAIWQPFLSPLWQLPPSAGWAMVALAAAGLALGVSARLTLGRLWSAAVTRKEGHRVVDIGPYALMRHPIYTALILGALALAGAKATPLALLGCAAMIVGYSMKARVEERFLAAELGEAAYAAYRRRVPMLVPFARASR